MNSAINFMRNVLQEEEKLRTLHWLLSLSFFLNVSLVTLKSFASAGGHKLSKVECYYVKGLLAFRMFCYGFLLGVLIYYWHSEGSCFREIFFLSYRITIFEALSECAFYYSSLLISDHNSLTLLPFVSEPSIHLFGPYQLLLFVRVLLLTIMWIEVRKNLKRRDCNKWIVMVVLGGVLPIIAMVVSMV
eukprot:TRINITY_DN1039_c0_g3_i1.p1 TRINITY_DN1039_c0_g3~~TRINITY_DN1039_c0_g3_i1.p1  ORF type:complete len:188 (+),score=28.31 TRINITY_DN1039_c0_g3_i1:100-663(+)